MIYENPIVPGFAPDPSVVMVESVFYLVNSSFHLYPGLPIYASHNLQEWTHIGNAINRPNQLSLARAGVDGFPIGGGQAIIAATGLFAPTIRYHKGTFCIICTNVRKEGDRLNTQNFYVTTHDIWADQWSDPIYFEFEGIDPSLYFDEDDHVYIQGSWHAGPLGNPTCSIRQFEVEITTGKPLSEIKTIWTGHLSKGDVEGPHIYKKDGYYYLMAAEGGTWQHHCITISRSTHIWGPYESYAANPILTGDGTDEYVQHTGHGDLFEDASGNWWAVHLGIRNEENRRAPMGRETFLTPVHWSEGEWPRIQQTRISFNSVEIEGGQNLALETFKKNGPTDKGFLYLRTPQLSDYKISFDRKMISLVARANNLSVGEGTASFLGQRQRGLTCTAFATLHLQRDQLQKGSVSLTKAGLSVFKDDIRHIDSYYDFATDSIYVAHTNKLKSKTNSAILSSHPAAEDTELIIFEIRASPNKYEFFFREVQKDIEDSSSATDWVCAGSVDTIEMTALDFTGPCFGIFATSPEQSEDDEPKRSIPEVLFGDFKVIKLS
ncbi:uncharacterized protein N7483_003056 [Penicillium malachiteum]|uniref:uncharacterized protein n=1 Tax=Penicillium malachiteum TaxID=1324776 RepID=UPI002547AB1E|nr:uncharacterized protein N7483_003056 [Penicillium malachiteum]KAJ5728548.1 hypothetical protein N7483_003056 [Penicillium malachiteum]